MKQINRLNRRTGLCALVIFMALHFAFIEKATGQNITLEPFADGLSQPLAIKNAGDDRLFIVEKRGRIRIVDATGATSATPFLDIRQRVSVNFNEMGLLGLAFHPNYSENGYFFVNYTDDDVRTIVSRFEVDPNDPDLALEGSEKVLMTFQQPYGNHNGGDIHFGPDGYLYIGMGDGGSGGDPENRSQNLFSYMGKILRIDVDNGDPYGIPPNNPFMNDPNIRPEIWTFGWRNPWRFSFDRLTGDMYVGDVGQNKYEEISFQPANSVGGENYGWRCYEANDDFQANECENPDDLVYPIQDYFQTFANGCSVTGGHVYRGTNTDAQGKYIYGDFCSGRFWTLEKNDADEWVNTIVGNMATGEMAGFGEDVNGEIYVAALSEGRIYKILFPVVSSDKNVALNPIRISPNPATDHLIIQGFEGGELEVRISDLSGKQLSLKTIMGGQKNRIDVSNIPTGAFLLSYEINGRRQVEKIIKL